MTTDTPAPYRPPDGVILTTMGEARRVEHGQVIPSTARPEVHRNWEVWDGRPNEALSDELVWWRPTPEPTVTIELTRTELRNLAETPDVGGDELTKIEAALARLDGES